MIAYPVVTGGAQAQDTAKKDDEIVEVIVTAQKRAEVASKTPVAITAFSGDMLKQQGVINVADVQNVAPSVAVGNDGYGVNLNIRGVTTTDTRSKGEQGIAFSVDGIPIGRPSEQGVAFFDTQRVEVLRGPQGTLYGKSSTGGAINVITNKPSSFFDAAGDVELGNYNTRRANLMLNLPLNDKLAVRFAVNSNKRDGFVELNNGGTPLNDEDNTSGRMSVLWKPADNFSFLATVTGGELGGVGSTVVPVYNVANYSGEAQRTGYSSPVTGDINEHYTNLNAEANYSFNGIRATVLGGSLFFKAHDLNQFAFNPAGNTSQYQFRLYQGDVSTDYAELRFSNDTPGKLDWVVGTNYFREDINESDHVWNLAVATPDISNSKNSINPLNETVHTSRGLFAQGTYHFTDKLGLTLGARQSSDAVWRLGTFAAGPGPWLDEDGNTCVWPNSCVGTANNASQTEKKTTWRVGLDYKLTPNQMIYGSVATGYKAGGFNDFDPDTGTVGTYEPEELTAYEIGYKGRIRSNLQYNTSAFYYDYSKDQISSRLLFGTARVIYTRSVPVKISGWENEVHWKPTSADAVDASIVFMDSHYVKFMAGINQNVDWSGKKLDKTPSTSGTLAYSHTWTLKDNNALVARIGTKYSADYLLSDFVNAVQFTQKAFTRTDLTLTYRFDDDKMYFEGFVKNLEDKIQAVSSPINYSASVADAAASAVSQPRMMGVRFGAKY
ncbi:MAG: TonB-dependent receptor [Asticcacaulis sp.]|uniref:TonB-dependent receptor n=1 Tax=Asticcacaulis sp. TaxID=1872648 RepID=UPI0039E51FFA